MISGCDELEVPINLLHTTSATLSARLQSLENAQGDLETTVATRRAAYQQASAQDQLASSFIQDTSRVLRKFLGTKYTEAKWMETGYPGQSTAVPETPEARGAGPQHRVVPDQEAPGISE
jgi:hypothetical protein